ncbi:molecular chaperone GrpE (heat shock protein) [Nocardiopsis sp. Huas11]|uniref:nucleotide exchange factor GrpE n=1 Tax=Nocardiopsis sp. Huas11 TaxID=2183912 RepID=UPI000EAB5A42|nr:nucleotide exchange factor GrpE [Nocardiopsis sp. Huas11]RKS04471.1 molecular chaperone GrpE (heat shock protein) [Nocardiopsis sp. Huas11]
MSEHTDAPGQSREQDGVAPSESEVSRQLAQLTDLFTRRLKDDRDKRALIEDLKDRLRTAENGAVLDQIAPFVTGTIRVVDRLDAHIIERAHREDPGGPTDPNLEFLRSVRLELLDLLAQHQVEQIDVQVLFDPRVHEVVEMRGDHRDGRDIRILALVRRGFHHPSRLLRPAQVVTEEVAAPERRSPDRAPW